MRSPRRLLALVGEPTRGKGEPLKKATYLSLEDNNNNNNDEGEYGLNNLSRQSKVEGAAEDVDSHEERHGAYNKVGAALLDKDENQIDEKSGDGNVNKVLRLERIKKGGEPCNKGHECAGWHNFSSIQKSVTIALCLR